MLWIPYLIMCLFLLILFCVSYLALSVESSSSCLFILINFHCLNNLKWKLPGVVLKGSLTWVCSCTHCMFPVSGELDLTRTRVTSFFSMAAFHLGSGWNWIEGLGAGAECEQDFVSIQCSSSSLWELGSDSKLLKQGSLEFQALLGLFF